MSSLSERVKAIKETRGIAPTFPENTKRTFDGMEIEEPTVFVPEKPLEKMDAINLVRIWSKLEEMDKKLDKIVADQEEISKRQKRMQTAFNKANKGKK